MSSERKELLLLYQQGFDGVWRLKDVRGAHIGTFLSPDLIEQWCQDNGYRCRNVNEDAKKGGAK